MGGIRSAFTSLTNGKRGVGPYKGGPAPAGAAGCSHGWSGGAERSDEPPRNPWDVRFESIRPGGAEGAPARGAASVHPDRSAAPPGRPEHSCRSTGSAAGVAARRLRRSTRGYSLRPLPGPSRSCRRWPHLELLKMSWFVSRASRPCERHHTSEHLGHPRPLTATPLARAGRP
ncbi:MAG: hypothetical protein AVDCRST_MAG64-1022 [uncultured Phycisphaerae bacterium]|uniref:Uncharacterized protein n=1 Tax=uncultured Phycisphaerae bacterium TaxID=904963 RepID=A0A6J4NGW6_9BACT|nr:MAG: hypothetical protein AVDCRST_MAG64-1022 [uncultured Phycisphaerae bacterium]